MTRYREIGRRAHIAALLNDAMLDSDRMAKHHQREKAKEVVRACEEIAAHFEIEIEGEQTDDADHKHEERKDRTI